jgi:hypothetical protein
MNINSDQIIYSEHDLDECFEFTDGKGRVPDGDAIGFVSEDGKSLTLFSDIVFSKYDHKYWNNLELENDINRVII